MMTLEQKMEHTFEERLEQVDNKLDDLRKFFDEKSIALHNELVALKRLYHEGKTNVKNGPSC